MFLKSRVLYTIENQRANSQKIYSDLNDRGLISSFFPAVIEGTPDLGLILFLESLPSGTIFSKSIMLDSQENTNTFVSLPFFSSHIKMPVKPGEYVWVFKDPYNKKSDSYKVNSYWLSRVHALNYTEDVNYTHNDRDFAFNLKSLVDSKNIDINDFSTSEKLDIKNLKKIAENSIIKPTNDFGETTFELNTDEIELIKDLKSKYPNTCIPAIMPNSDDLVFQGSNNTLLKLTTNNYSSGYSKNKKGSGEVCISAGAGAFAENTFSLVNGNFYNNQAETSKLQVFNAYFPSHPNKSIKLLFDGEEENFKNPNLFSVFSDEVIPESVNEGVFSIVEDASKISICEAGNNESLFLKNYSTLFNLNVTSDVTVKGKITNSSLLDEAKEYKTFYYIKNRNSILPSIKNPTVDISSSNINLYSRVGGDGVKIIKEYYNSIFNKNLNSIFRINNNGDMFLDSNRIFIGNGEYYKIKKSLIENNLSNQLDENKEYNGALVILGESSTSQQLVLGNQLKEYLNEILDVNREDMDKTKDLFRETHRTIVDSFESLTNNLKSQITTSANGIATATAASLTPLSTPATAANPVTGAQVATALAPITSSVAVLCANMLAAIEEFNLEFLLIQSNLESSINDVKMKRDEELSQRLRSIEDNIDKILSKISKTS